MKLYMKGFAHIGNVSFPTPREELLAGWTDHLGVDFMSSLEDNFWFCISQSNCGPNCKAGCHDKTGKFIYAPGTVSGPKNS